MNMMRRVAVGALLVAVVAALPQALVHTAPETQVDPFKLITEKDANFSKLFNSQDFQSIQDSVYAASAAFVPPGTYDLLPQSAVASALQKLYEEGVHHVDLSPTIVLQESDSLLHELGYLAAVPSEVSGPYYVRWEFDATLQDWFIAVDIAAIGVPLASGNAAGRDSAGAVAPDIAKLEGEFAKTFAAGNFSQLQTAFYNPGAQLVPASADVLKEASSVGAYWQAWHEMGATAMQRTPQGMHQASDQVVHEVGTITTNLGVGAYYVRWIQGGELGWQVAFEIQGMSHP